MTAHSATAALRVEFRHVEGELVPDVGADVALVLTHEVGGLQGAVAVCPGEGEVAGDHGGLAAAVAIATWFVGTLGPVPDLRLLGSARPDATPALAYQARASADRTVIFLPSVSRTPA